MSRLTWFCGVLALLALTIVSAEQAPPTTTSTTQLPSTIPATTVATGGACELGVDTHDLVSKEQFQCLKGKGYNYAIVRAERPGCTIDPNAAQSIRNAWASGMREVDVYFFPTFTCGLPPHQQVNQLLDHLEKEKAPFGRVWLDIESSGSRWSVKQEENQKWVMTALQTLESRLKGTERIGIYSSVYGYGAVLGNLDLSKYRLWYAHYDRTPQLVDNLNGDFGGWRKASGFMKQFNGDLNICNAAVDLNVRRGQNAKCYDYGLLVNGVPGQPKLTTVSPRFQQIREQINEAQSQTQTESTVAAIAPEQVAEAQKSMSSIEQSLKAQTEAASHASPALMETESESENESEVESENENESESELENEIDPALFAEAEHEVVHELESQVSMTEEEHNAIVQAAQEAEVHAMMLELEATTRYEADAPPRTEEEKKKDKQNHSVTHEKKKKYKCTKKDREAPQVHCDCKQEGPSPFVPVVA